MLRVSQLDGVYDKPATAIARIKTMAPVAELLYGGYTVMVSGGKDSSVITDLAVRSGAKIKFETSWTGIEHPETVYFLRRERERLRSMGYSFEFVVPRDRDGKQTTMWKLIEKGGFPTRRSRFCCAALKEFNSGNKYVILGVRWAESPRRKTRRRLHEEKGRYSASFMTNSDNDAGRRWSENCMRKNELVLNPVIEWTDEEVWEYIGERGLPYNPLYDRGYKRVGCIGCPMRGNRKDFEDNPRYAALYKKSGAGYLRNKNLKGEKTMSAEEYFSWWVSFCGGGWRPQKNIIELFGDGEEKT
jgi:phosphoadenosine phosphosulfate reductase